MSSDPYDLDLLPFEVPEFSRASWVSDEARATWQPRIERIVAAWAEIEVLATTAASRACAVTTVGADELPEFSARQARRMLNTLPLGILRQSASYSSASSAPVYGEPFAYRVVVGSPADVAALQQAWEECDDDRIGALLGYPDCCREFFREVWVDHGLRDTTWPMAARTAAARRDGRVIEMTACPETNILWRWMGVRAVAHLPCALDCEASVACARDAMEAGRRAGFEDEVEWMREILSWPVEWSCLHGIAEIKTPILKVSASCDATASRFVVRLSSDRYPEEGARGLSFPYRRPATLRITESRAFENGLKNPLPVVSEQRS